jgi:hypothetical protein
MYTCPASYRILSRGPPPHTRSRAALVLDLDETLLHRSRGVLDTLSLYGGFGARAGEPYPSALAAVGRLQERFNVVVVTARWRAAAGGTRRWLDARGLGGVGAVHASAPHPGDGSRAAFKAAAVRQLREWGWRPVAGLGDRPSDLEAYAGEGLAALMLTHAVGAPAGAPVGAAQRLLTAEAALRGRSGSGGGGGGDGGGAAPCVLHFADCAAARALPGMRAAPPRALPGAARGRAGGALFTGARLGVPLWEQVEEALEGLGLQ